MLSICFIPQSLMAVIRFSVLMTILGLYLVANHILEKPILYLSEFFEKNKGLYYDNLTRVRTHNDLTQWIKFFLTGIIETATNSVETLEKIIELKTHIEKDKILTMGKRSKHAIDLFHKLFSKPVVTVAEIQKITNLSVKASNELARIFVEKNILKETTGYKRNRIFVFEEYIRLFK